MTAERATVQRYEIEWCSNIPVDEYGDFDMDRATYEVRDFPTFEEAKTEAWKVLREGVGQLPWDIVTIELQERRQDEDMWECHRRVAYRWEPVTRWEATGDGEDPAEI